VKALKAFVAVGVLFISLPLWFYLLYKVLQAVNATDLMWFLFWVYVPFTIVLGIMQKLIEAAADE